MEVESVTFIRALILGKAKESDIDDWIKRWHKGEGERHLWDFLGMTAEEYHFWVYNPAFLKEIIKHHTPRES